MTTKTTKITSKGQVTIPIEFRQALGFEPGDRLDVEQNEDSVVVRKHQSWAERTAGILAAYRLDPPLTPRQERELYMQAVADEQEAILRQADENR
ncbi:MAG: AbrB/MazE/SpoVT family DNA-binding domain-containing protein [Thermomicrobiales bacterium]|nr:AbrB/MazE/SpoVT family DNA-binding domain-containing protein [Thermomicrobiales bacterium]